MPNSRENGSRDLKTARETESQTASPRVRGTWFPSPSPSARPQGLKFTLIPVVRRQPTLAPKVPPSMTSKAAVSEPRRVRTGVRLRLRLTFVRVDVDHDQKKSETKADF
jgi:hypothetical protein